MEIEWTERFTPPYRLGRKQKRAVLDANGLEVVIFPLGGEDEAQKFTDYLNRETHMPVKTWTTDWA